MAAPGKVDLECFDKGIILHLGSVVETCRKQSGQTFYSFAVSIPGVTGPKEINQKIPVKIIPVDVKYYPDLLPSIAIRPDIPSIAMDRFRSNQIGGRWAAPGSKQVTVTNSIGVEVTGFTRYQQREAAQPFDFNYEIIATATTREDMVRMQVFLARKFPKFGSLTVMDSLNEERMYDMYLDSATGNSELMNVAERNIGVSFTVKVLGEIDIFDDVEYSAATTVDLTVSTT